MFWAGVTACWRSRNERMRDARQHAPIPVDGKAVAKDVNEYVEVLAWGS